VPDDPVDDAEQTARARRPPAGWKVIIGGSALPLPLARKAIEHGIDVIAGYGMSETCPVLTLAHLRPHMMDWGRRTQACPISSARAAPFPSCSFASWTPT
jgi:fatty-acyl-CoA synthase